VVVSTWPELDFDDQHEERSIPVGDPAPGVSDRVRSARGGGLHESHEQTGSPLSVRTK
jgi:hypothetical protein